jgi:hypothetical protein
MASDGIHSNLRQVSAICHLTSAITFTALILALLACGHSTTAPQLGDDIELHYGASVEIPGDTVHVRFTDVTSDSRCPIGVLCIWAGEAAALFSVGANQTVTLTLGADAAKAMAIVRGYHMMLVALKPYPTAGGSPIKADYVATLRFTSAND